MTFAHHRANARAIIKSSGIRFGLEVAVLAVIVMQAVLWAAVLGS